MYADIGIAVGIGAGVAVLGLAFAMVMIIKKKKKSTVDKISASDSPNDYPELSITKPTNYAELNFEQPLRLSKGKSGDYDVVCPAPVNSRQYETVIGNSSSDNDHVYSKINNYVNLSSL